MIEMGWGGGGDRRIFEFNQWKWKLCSGSVYVCVCVCYVCVVLICCLMFGSYNQRGKIKQQINKEQNESKKQLIQFYLVDEICIAKYRHTRAHIHTDRGRKLNCIHSMWFPILCTLIVYYSCLFSLFVPHSFALSLSLSFTWRADDDDDDDDIDVPFIQH